MSDAIVLDRISKSYASTRALVEASLSVEAGSVHALLGENGAGKSTISKLLSGIIRPDDGRIVVFGDEVQLVDRAHSSRLGIETAFQEVPLIPDLTVADNLLLPRQPRKWGVFLDRRAAREHVDFIRSTLEIGDVDMSALVRELDLSQRQKVEIARAISRDPRILILDEPTAALSKTDVDWLGRRIGALKEAGTTIILVTHRMPEVHEFCSSMSILRNGRHIGRFRVGEVADEEVFRHIMGRSVDVTFPKRSAEAARVGVAGRAASLEARSLSVGHQLKSVSLTLHPGEIVGIAALQGMGQIELFNGLFGAARPSSGSVVVEGRPGHFGSPADAIAAGVALIPEDRKFQGLALHRSGTENASLPVIRDFSRLGIVDRTREAAKVDSYFAAVNLHPGALYQSPAEFSGGNQQKIVLAKWLLTQCRTLLVFDPTRGVDIGTKHEIYLLLRRFADNGGGVLFHSTELPELIGNCDRILVLYRGEIAGEVTGEDAKEQTIGALMLGAPNQQQRKLA